MNKIHSSCSCGSGKKYKLCCGTDVQSYGDNNDGMSVAEPLAQAIQASVASTFEEMNAISQRLSNERHTRSVNAFLGLSPMQMTRVLYYPLESPEVVSVNEGWLPEHAMAL